VAEARIVAKRVAPAPGRRPPAQVRVVRSHRGPVHGRAPIVPPPKGLVSSAASSARETVRAIEVEIRLATGPSPLGRTRLRVASSHRRCRVRGGPSRRVANRCRGSGRSSGPSPRSWTGADLPVTPSPRGRPAPASPARWRPSAGRGHARPAASSPSPCRPPIAAPAARRKTPGPDATPIVTARHFPLAAAARLSLSPPARGDWCTSCWRCGRDRPVLRRARIGVCLTGAGPKSVVQPSSNPDDMPAEGSPEAGGARRSRAVVTVSSLSSKPGMCCSATFERTLKLSSVRICCFFPVNLAGSVLSAELS
jgi:hypothetical protein